MPSNPVPLITPTMPSQTSLPQPGSVPQVGADPDMSWWERYNTGIRRMHETGWGADVAVLSREICELLDDVDATFADITRAREELGWSPRVKLEDGLATVVEWLKSEQT